MDDKLEVLPLVGAAQTGGTCSVFAACAVGGAVLPPYRSDEHDLLLVVLRGRVRVSCGGEDPRVLDGEGAVWLPRRCPCRIELLGDCLAYGAVFPAGLDSVVKAVAHAGGGVLGDDLPVLLAMAGVELLPRSWGAKRSTSL